ncbi:MAG: phage/plasmid primase, P4 family [Candidatus Fimivivens sp.]|nr:phage/plasmid primase, P4 family [Candidatus Fimivivens sp.]
MVTQNKTCIEKFKGVENLKTYEQVQSLPEFAGILDENTILIDVDDFEQSEVMFKIVEAQNLNCRVYKTTRGKHFLFNNTTVATNRTKATLAIGLNADIKLGKKNSYSVLKFNGKEREILRDIQGDAPDLLPKWLVPVKGSVDFIGMEQGDGRNQALFNYILTLQSEDFTKEEARECIRLINRFVLTSPLSDSELDVVLRDDAFKKPIFFKGSAFLFDKFAMFLKNNIHVVKVDGVLHFYDNTLGVYISGQKRFDAAMLQQIPQLNRAKRKEVYDYLDAIIVDNAAVADANLIAFRNGIYDIVRDEFKPHTAEHIILNRIDWDYNPKAKSEIVDNVLDTVSCKDPQIRGLLEEVVGYCFYRRNELGKSFVLTGEKDNGKSTFLDMIKTMLGDKNITALDLAEVNERFSTAELHGKLANIGDDIGDEFIPNTGVFKKLVTGERLKGERKGQDPFFFQSYAKLLFSANNIPRLGRGKDSAAIAKRLIIIPFDARIDRNSPDFKPYIKYDLHKPEAMEYLILLGLVGLKRVLYNNKFSESSKVQGALNEYEETNNPILGFFNSMDVAEILNQPTNEVYKRYQEFCIRDNLQPLSNIEFSRQVKRHFDIEIGDKKIQGKKYRVFIERTGTK